MSYIPGNGFKKPQNQLENPIYPDIKQTLPEFKWSGKHWRVDQGRTIIDTQDTPQFYDHAVLVQSRAYNSQNRYGVSSHKSVVNQNFRPPILRQEDYLPLTRLPRETVVPRINPGTHENYQTQNNRPVNIDKYVNDRLGSAEARPTFYKPMDLNPLQPPIFAPVVPEQTIPTHSNSAGFVIPGSVSDYKGTYDPYKLTNDKVSPSLNPGMIFNPIETPSDFGIDLQGTMQSKILDLSGSAGFNISYNSGAQTSLGETFKKVDRVGVSVSSGHNPSLTSQNYYVAPEGIVDLDRTISVTAGMEVPSMSGVERTLGSPPKRVRETPKISTSSGHQTSYSLRSEIPDINLEKKNPSYSVGSGSSIPFRTITSPHAPVTPLVEKLNPHVIVRNAAPTSPSGIGDIGAGFQSSKVRIVDNLPVRSYEVPKSMPHTTSNDDGSRHAKFRKKSDAFGYAPYENKGFIPKFGLDIQPVSLKVK